VLYALRKLIEAGYVKGDHEFNQPKNIKEITFEGHLYIKDALGK
jgi:hypothetical protein